MDLNRVLVEATVRSCRTQTLPENSVLRHYASAYYDPDKAKAYYERTKELKGRDPAMTKEQRDVYAVSKSNMSTAKTNAIDNVKADQKALLDELRGKAKAAVAALDSKLEQLAKDLSDKIRAVTDANAAKPLNKIPPNASPKAREFLENQNRQIQANNAKQATALSKTKSQIMGNANKEAQKQRGDIGKKLKGELQNARDGYKSKTESIKTKYATADSNEKANIREQIK